MTASSIQVEVEDPAWTAALPDVQALAGRAAEAALKRAEPAAAPDVVVLLTDDATVAELNGRFRGKADPTNVLSFPAVESARPHVGDLALAYGVCAAEAEAQGKPLAHHLAHLVVHGVLHLVGYDHETNAEAEVMEGMERAILAENLDIRDPYAAQPDTDVE